MIAIHVQIDSTAFGSAMVTDLFQKGKCNLRGMSWKAERYSLRTITRMLGGSVWENLESLMISSTIYHICYQVYLHVIRPRFARRIRGGGGGGSPTDQQN